MLNILRDYGSLIGPTFAFTLAVMMLWVKEIFDRHAASRRGERRLLKIAALLKNSPPPMFQDPSRSADRTSAMLQNAVSFSHFYDRMAAVEGALESAEISIHESGPVELIMRYHRVKQNLSYVLDERSFFRKPNENSSPIPDEDNFFNVSQSWRSMLVAADPANESTS